MAPTPETWRSRLTDAQAASYLRRHPGFAQASLDDPDEATAQTVRYMAVLVRHSQSDPIVGAAADQAWRDFHGLAGDDPAVCAWWFAKHTLRFVHHQELLVHWLGLPDELQLLISPEAVLKLEQPKGDCAVYTTLIQAMLEHWGIPWETVTVAVNPMRPDLYTHVYAQAIRADGSRIPLDASHGKYPGWEAPSSRVFKKKLGTGTVTKSIQEVN
jgi:hypothetical protein